MTRFPRLIAVLAVIAAAGCASASSSSSTRPVPAGMAPWNEADARFMQGMIEHHAQAILIAGWAESHGANQQIRVLAGRIIVSQQDEIGLMTTWLRDRGQTVPDAGHAAMGHTSHPGMLNAAQLAQLEAARGPEFDRLFLTLMIQHHRGALTMVNQLLGSESAAQQPRVFKMAADMHADQEAEIDRMTRMLEQSGGRTP